MRKEYEMTQAQYDVIIEAIQPVPYMIMGGVAPMSQQERANNAWKRLGEEMGFKYMTVEPGNSTLSFTAEPSDDLKEPS